MASQSRLFSTHSRTIGTLTSSPAKHNTTQHNTAQRGKNTMASIFLTGATGYIGGQVLHEVARKYPQHHITVLVRDSQKAAHLKESYPQIQTVIGDFDDAEVLERESSKATIVLHLGATGHLASVQSIHRGLAKKESSGPVYWIQVSGASALAAAELASPTFVPGQGSDVVYDDIADEEELVKLIKAHPSRAVDNYILNVSSESPKVKTALVFPPIIYGRGEGPGNQRSIQVPDLARVTLERGHGVRIGQGLSRWGNIDIKDLGRLFGGLVEAAISPAAESDSKVWGPSGLYLASSGELSFGEISAKVARAAVEQGFNASDEVEELHKPEADTVFAHGSVLYGTNARSKARRAADYLGWAASEQSLEVEIPRAVAEEAKSLGRTAA
ncbi:hypothetical protein BX600DRAFT_444838 [Xylariales sp. PMI_506]|nr:hypothetical protein BX600DRAFT_444838 [Xylariales sp. PMI_506]